MPDGPTVSDTSCLIALERIGRLGLLERLYGGDLIIPAAVVGEWGRAVPKWMSIHAVRNRDLVCLLEVGLGLGESEAIALSVEIDAARLIVDDKQGRRTAGRFQIPLTGTVGVVLRAKERGLIAAVRPVLDELRSAGFQMSPSLIQQAHQLAAE